MRRIKVCLLGLPSLLADMALDALGADPELEVTIEHDRRTVTPHAHADAIVTVRAPAAVEALLLASPRLQAFVISRGTHTVRRVRLRPVHDELGELSLAELAGAIKESIQQRR